jgi:REP element-mobilizing transposase RayT
MGRPRRVYVPGALYHVIVRGNNRAAIFVTRADRLKFLELLAITLDRHGQTLHAYCLMTSHAHLLVQTSAWPISLLAHDLCFRYARWMNRRLGQTGHFFERRHRSILIESDRQLLLALRYVHRNPVEAGLVAAPDDHPWSSHLAYLGRRCSLTVTTSLCLRLLDEDRDRAAAGYARLAATESELDLEDLLPPVGASRIVDAAAAAARPPGGDTWRRRGVTLAQVLAAIEAELQCSPAELRSVSRASRVRVARGLATAVVRELPRVRIQELARELGRDPSTLSLAATAFAHAARCQPALRESYARVVGRLGIQSLGPC